MSSSNTPRVIIQGQEVTYPVCVRDASSGAATFLVNAGAARRLIPGDEVEVAEVVPGRALCSLAIIDYKDNDLGDYNEVSIALFVRPRGESHGIPYLGNMLAMAQGKLGTCILHLPVNQSFTCEAGCSMWGFPKTVQEITFDYAPERASARLVYDGEHAMTLSVPRGGGGSMPEADMTTYTWIGHVAHKTRFTSKAEGFGVKLGGAELSLGSGPLADELRSLGLPKKALMCMWMEKMSGIFDPAEKL